MKAQIIVLLAIFVSLNAQAEKTLQECIDTVDSIERLECYDAKFRKKINMVDQSQQKQIVGVEGQTINLVNDFGKEQVQSKKDIQSEIHANVIGEIISLSKGDKINLDNGQQWIVMAGNRFYIKKSNPAVIVSKGAFGSYYLKFKSYNKRLKVRREK